ncbi:M23 family metallopeptidase [Nitrogeniibacter aestuarii]|uniref:M23 family metallopeptidase n=1 Tax=Nitrogeniibacter aestuarii TaxID=2815343 RepID=UPI001E604CA7|nr:M23 family metallopeptidase [Nitrogeniibacter aestuarii]
MPTPQSPTLSNPINNGSRRGSDKWGSGHFAAPRGSRQHNGVDISASLGEAVLSPIDAKVVRVAYPYATDLSLTGILLEGVGRHAGFTVKIFYMSPEQSKIGKQVSAGERIGAAQSLLTKYPGIKNHIHLEVRQNGVVIDPQSLMPTLH